MRQLVALALSALVLAPSALAQEGRINAITDIAFEEGPNNTVIVITTASTPTFTVFKLSDPTRVLIDVVDGDTSRVARSVPVRNGVLHDIELVQLDNRGKRVGRVQLGFDVDAPYSVKAEGGVIRLVVDGTQRREITATGDAELAKRAQDAIESERRLREELRAARERESRLSASELAAREAETRLQGEVAKLAKEAERLAGLVKTGDAGAAAGAEAATRAREAAQAAEAAKVAAEARVKALALEQQRLEDEQGALARAVATAEKRRTALEAALAAEERRRDAAQRVRLEEEQLASAAKAQRLAEEARIEALQGEGKSREVSESERVAQKEALRTLSEEKNAATRKVAELEKELSASRAGDAKQVAQLEKALAGATEKNEDLSERLAEALDRFTEAKDSAKGTAEEKAKAVAELGKQVKRLEQAVERARGDLHTAEKTAEETARRLAAEDKARAAAEAEVETLRNERVAAAQRAQSLEREKKELVARSERLAREKESLEAAIATGRKQQGVEAVLASMTAEVERLRAEVSAAKDARTTAARDLGKAEDDVQGVRRQLQRERDDLTAVLQKRDLFAKEVDGLKKRRDDLAADATAQERRLGAAEARLAALATQRERAEAQVAELRAEVQRLEGQEAEADDKLVLQKLLDQRKARVAELERQMAAERSAAQSERNQQDERLAKALEAAKAAQKRGETTERDLAKLKQFADAQRGQNATLEKKVAELEAENRQIAGLERELEALRGQTARQVDLSKVKDAELRTAIQEARERETAANSQLATTRKSLRDAETRLAGLERDLEREQKSRTAAERDLATAKTTIDGLNAASEKTQAELSAAQRQVAALERDAKRNQADVARLERELEEAQASGSDAASTSKELAEARKRLRSTEKSLEDLRAEAAEAKALIRSKDEALAEAEKQRDAARRDVKNAEANVLRLEKALGSTTDAGAAARELADAQAQRDKAARRVEQLEVAVEKAEKVAADKDHALAEATKRLESLASTSDTASREVERLERALQKAQSAGAGAADVAAELAEARSHLRKAEAELASEKAARKSALAEADKRVRRLEAERDKLAGTVAAQEKAASGAVLADKDVGRELARARQKIADLSRQLTVAEARDAAGASAELARLERERSLLEKRVKELEGRAVDPKLEKALAESRLEAESLQRQLAAARREKGDADALAKLSDELGAVRRDLARARETAEKTAEDLDAARKTAAGLEKRLVAAETSREKADQSLAGANARIQALDSELSAAGERITRLQGEVERVRRGSGEATAILRELADAERDRERLERAVAAAKSEATVASKERDAARTELALAQKTAATSNKARDAAQSALAGAEGRATEAERARAEAGKALAVANAQLETLSAEKTQATRRLERLTTDLAAAQKAGTDSSALGRELAQARKDRARLDALLSEARGAADKAEQERDTARSEVAAAERRATSAEKARTKVERELDEARGRIAKLGDEARTAEARVDTLDRELKSVRSRGGDTAQLAGQLEKAKSELSAARRELSAERTRRDEALSTAKAEVSRLEREQRAMEKDLATARASGDHRVAAAVKEREKRIAALEKDLEKARKSAGDAGAMAAAVAEAERAKSELAKMADRLSAIERKKEEPEVAAGTRVTNVAFSERNNVSRIEIELDGRAGYEVVEKSNDRIVLLIDKARIPKVLERRLDTRDFYGPVTSVSSFTDPENPEKVRVVVELAEAVRNEVVRRGKSLVWEFHNGQRVEQGERAVADAERVQFRPTAVGGERSEAPPDGGVGVSGGGGGEGPQVANNVYNRKRSSGRKFKGQKINLTIKDADIQQVLTFLAREGGVNIVTSEEVQGNVTVHLKDVPWDLALDMILKSKGLDYVEEDGVYRIAMAEAIRAEFEAEIEKRKKLNELRQLVVKLVTVNYADAEAMSGQVKAVLSEKGKVDVDARTNTLIVTDVQEHVDAAEDIVRRLDTQTPQVLIEARIVEASSNFTEDFGIQWGGNYTASPAFGNETGLVFPAVVGFSGAADDSTSPSTGLLQDIPKYAVNLPAAVGAGSGGGIALTLGSLNGAGNLNLRLGAAEERGQIKIVSSPRIATMDNIQAIIKQGISIPISVVSSLGVNTQFFNAELSLTVTPQVTQDGNVNLAIAITKNEPNFAQTGANGNPTIERKEAQTTLLVRDGDTAVIGGIYTRNSSQDFKKVPVLADIPFLGWMFKNRTIIDKRTELILFITPRIINRQAARVRVD